MCVKAILNMVLFCVFFSNCFAFFCVISPEQIVSREHRRLPPLITAAKIKKAAQHDKKHIPAPDRLLFNTN